MTSTHTRILLWSATAGLTVAAGAMIVWAGTSSLALPAAEASKSPQRAMEHDLEATKIPPLSSFEELFDAATRRPLYDTAPVADATPVTVDVRPDAPAPSMHLIGTALEPGHSIAFFRAEGSTVELRAIGGKVGDAVITTIQRDSVTVLLNGRPVTLKVELSPVRPPALVPLVPSSPADSEIIEVPPIRTGVGPIPGTGPGPSDPH